MTTTNVGPTNPLHAWLIASVKEKNQHTQKQLAAMTGMSEKHVSQMLTGRVEGSLSAWSALLVAAGALTVEVNNPPGPAAPEVPE